MKRVILWGIAALAVLGAGFFFFVLAGIVEGQMNQVRQAPPYTVSERASALHKTLTVADLHADSLLFGRDLNAKATRGQVDVPRLIEGNVAVQVFAVVSKTPKSMNIENNTGDTDNITTIAIANRWPVEAWTSLKARALYQASQLKQFAAESDGRLVIIETKHDLADFLEKRKSNPNMVAGILALEGAQVLEGDPANVGPIFDAGYRMMAPTHFFDNEMAGSAHGVEKAGLTEAGREMIRLMEGRKMIVDIAHGSVAQIDDVLDMATRPVVVSHTGVKGTCDNNRNLSDDQLRKIAAKGGLIGIGFWDTATCGTDAAATARAQKYVADLIGVQHVGNGSDFDGAVTTPFDASGMAVLTEALIETGLSDADIGAVMGGNQVRFLMENLPD
ncbi:MAG: membrane dipeptidase [Mesorhizobium sp.]